MALITQVPSEPIPDNYTFDTLRARGWTPLVAGGWEIGLPDSHYHRSYIVQAQPLALSRVGCPGAPATAWALETNHGGDAVLENEMAALQTAERWLKDHQQWRQDDIDGKHVVPPLSEEDADIVPF